MVEELKGLFTVVDLNTELVYNLPEYRKLLLQKGFFCRLDQGQVGRFCSQILLILLGIFCMISELKLPTLLKHQFMWKLVHNH